MVRRRRSRRHRRNRTARRVLLIVFCVGLALGVYLEIPSDAAPQWFSSIHLHRLSSSLPRSSRAAEPDRLAVTVNQNLLSRLQQESLPQPEIRPIYPYSVVPGGVKDAQELRLAAARDPVVAAHYAGFDYAHARAFRLMMARRAYVSYRIRNRVYWTRRRVTLNKGETVITDGKTIARARCANQVKEVAPPPEATSGNEPPAALFDEPKHPASGTAMAGPPVGFESALLNRPPVPGLGPAPPLGMVDPFGGGSWTPITPACRCPVFAESKRTRTEAAARRREAERKRAILAAMAAGPAAKSGARDLADGGYRDWPRCTGRRARIRAKLAATCRVKLTLFTLSHPLTSSLDAALAHAGCWPGKQVPPLRRRVRSGFGRNDNLFSFCSDDRFFFRCDNPFSSL